MNNLIKSLVNAQSILTSQNVVKFFDLHGVKSPLNLNGIQILL